MTQTSLYSIIAVFKTQYRIQEVNDSKRVKDYIFMTAPTEEKVAQVSMTQVSGFAKAMNLVLT